MDQPPGLKSPARPFPVNTVPNARVPLAEHLMSPPQAAVASTEKAEDKGEAPAVKGDVKKLKEEQ